MPTPVPKWQALTYPFNLTIWLLLLAVVAVFGLILVTLFGVDWYLAFTWILQTLTGKGNRLDLSLWELAACRVCWMLAASFLYYMYGGFLTSGMITTSYKWQPRTWDELIASDYTIGMPYVKGEVFQTMLVGGNAYALYLTVDAPLDDPTRQAFFVSAIHVSMIGSPEPS